MTDEEFMELRTYCHQLTKEKHDTVLSAWCREAGVKTPIGYYLDYSDGTYYVYTNRPGFLIGKGGCLVDKYKQLLQTRFPEMKSIKFVEIKGGFSNYHEQ